MEHAPQISKAKRVVMRSLFMYRCKHFLYTKFDHDVDYNASIVLSFQNFLRDLDCLIAISLQQQSLFSL